MRPGRAGLPEPTPVSDRVVVPSTLVKLTTPARGEASQAAPSAQVAVVIPLLRETVSGTAATGGASHAPRNRSRSKRAVAHDRRFMRGLLMSRLWWREIINGFIRPTTSRTLMGPPLTAQAAYRGARYQCRR